MIMLIPYMQRASKLLVLHKFISSTRLYNSLASQLSSKFHSFSNVDSLVSALITAISTCRSISYCWALHCRVIKSLNCNHGFIGDQLVSRYVELGCTKDSLELFDELPEKDLVSWNSIISGFSRRGDLGTCLGLLFKMRLEMGLKPNEVTVIPVVSACVGVGEVDVGEYIHGIVVKLGMHLEVKVVNSLINLYGKCGHLEAACCLFEGMPVQSLVSWNSMVAVHVHMGLAEKGIGYFIMMRRGGINSDQATVVSLLLACEILGVRKLAEAVHGYILNGGLDRNLAVATALLDLYAKLGILSDPRKVFGEMIDPDAVAWTAMLSSYAMHGRGREAIEHFELMVREGVVPDHVTFTHLLSACSHSGLVEEGKNYFKIMYEVYGVEPRVEHYSCMVDLLGRSGHLNDAYKLIKSMPMEPNSGVWGALFGACRVRGNIELGKEVSEKLFSLDPSDSRNYIMLSNMYSAAGQWRDASKVRVLMKERVLIRNPGCSCIEHGNKMHCFVMGDHSHPDIEQICYKLEELVRKNREFGFASKTEYVLHDVDEEVKEDLINKHSEKLAIAFGLLVTNPGMPLIVTKNIRICGDCHGFAKLVSLIEKRTIIIRDTKRFHHFTNGLCSCGDYCPKKLPFATCHCLGLQDHLRTPLEGERKGPRKQYCG